MKAPSIVTAKVIDLNAERAARRARPFQSGLLRKTAAALPPEVLQAIRQAVAEGFAAGTPTAQITRSILCDQVQRKARAEL